VGDAGHHKDPAGGFGISDAFRDAELLSDALDAGLSGRRPMSDSLADYERARNEAALPAYDFNYRLASMKAPNAVSRALYDALSKNQKEATSLSRGDGDAPARGFFAPGNVRAHHPRRRLTGRAGREPGGVYGHRRLYIRTKARMLLERSFKQSSESSFQIRQTGSRW